MRFVNISEGRLSLVNFVGATDLVLNPGQYSGSIVPSKAMIQTAIQKRAAMKVIPESTLELELISEVNAKAADIIHNFPEINKVAEGEGNLE